MFTSGTDILCLLGSDLVLACGCCCVVAAGVLRPRAIVVADCGCSGEGRGSGIVLPGYGGAAGGAAGVVRRLVRVFGGGRPAAARRAMAAWRASNAARMRWLRAVRAQASQSVSGVRPVRRHQPRAMLVVAVSLMVEKPRSALVRRVQERRHWADR